MHPIKVTVNSSVMKYPPTKLLGHPAALIKPKSRVRCAIIKKTIKDVRTAPTMKMRAPMKVRNCPKVALKPNVKVPRGCG